MQKLLFLLVRTPRSTLHFTSHECTAFLLSFMGLLARFDSDICIAGKPLVTAGIVTTMSPRAAYGQPPLLSTASGQSNGSGPFSFNPNVGSTRSSGTPSARAPSPMLSSPDRDSDRDREFQRERERERSERYGDRDKKSSPRAYSPSASASASNASISQPPSPPAGGTSPPRWSTLNMALNASAHANAAGMLPVALGRSISAPRYTSLSLSPLRSIPVDIPDVCVAAILWTT